MKILLLLSCLCVKHRPRAWRCSDKLSMTGSRETATLAPSKGQKPAFQHLWNWLISMLCCVCLNRGVKTIWGHRGWNYFMGNNSLSTWSVHLCLTVTNSLQSAVRQKIVSAHDLPSNCRPSRFYLCPEEVLICELLKCWLYFWIAVSICCHSLLPGSYLKRLHSTRLHFWTALVPEVNSALHSISWCFMKSLFKEL